MILWITRRLALPLVLAILVAAASCAAPSPGPTPDTRLCGDYPMNYKEIVTQWLATVLVDPKSSNVEWKGDPKPADLGKDGQHLYGYLVEFRVNSRNRFGGYTGMQSHAALIYSGEVIKGVGFGY